MIESILKKLIVIYFVGIFQGSCGNGTTAPVNTDGTVLYQCDLHNVTACGMEIDIQSTSSLQWTVTTKYNANPTIKDKSNPGEGIFLIFHSWRTDGISTSVASTPELQLPTGKGTLSFNYYMWDVNDIPQTEYPKFKVFSCGNETRAIWKRTGDKLDRWITANIYLNCRDTFKISFEATVNSTNCGVALDDIVIKSGHVSTPGPTTQPPSTKQDKIINDYTKTNGTITGTDNSPMEKEGDGLVIILIGIIIGLVFIIVVGICIHCYLNTKRRRRKKAELELADANAKRKRFQESKAGPLTSSGYMTLTKPNQNENIGPNDLGAIDLTNAPRSEKKNVLERGKTLPRQPSLPEEAKQQQPPRHSLNIDVTYDYVDDELNDVNLSTNSQVNRENDPKAPNKENQSNLTSPVYLTLTPREHTYSHLSEYGSMPDVVRNAADENGVVYKPNLAAKHSQRRKSSLTSLKEKLSKGLSPNSSHDYDELKDEEYYDVVNVKCQL